MSHRPKIEKIFNESTPLHDKKKEYISPSSKYRLIVTPFKTGERSWEFTLGVVEKYDPRLVEAREVTRVLRNYSSFWFAWVEGHPNGHDYLLCGEDYQGQTVIELDTGERRDYLPAQAQQGFGFCWAKVTPSPNKQVLAVDGCYWACPYEVVLFDFRDPLNVPWPELGRWEDVEEMDYWKDDNTIILSRTIELRKSDGKLMDELTDDELDAIKDEEIGFKKIITTWTPEMLGGKK